jgi:hypothetical protein
VSTRSLVPRASPHCVPPLFRFCVCMPSGCLPDVFFVRVFLCPSSFLILMYVQCTYESQARLAPFNHVLRAVVFAFGQFTTGISSTSWLWRGECMHEYLDRIKSKPESLFLDRSDRLPCQYSLPHRFKSAWFDLATSCFTEL